MKRNRKTILLVISIIFLVFIVPGIQQRVIDFIIKRRMDTIGIVIKSQITREHYEAIFYTENFLYVYIMNTIVNIMDILGIGLLTSILLKKFLKITFKDSLLGTIIFFLITIITVLAPLSDINKAVIKWVESMFDFFEILKI